MRALPDDVRLRWLRDDPAQHEAWEALLSDAERERLHGFRSEARRQQFRTGRAAFRQLAADALGLPPREVPLTVAPSGALVLQGASLHVGLAHSGPYAVAALAGRPLGVDVEQVRPCHPRLLDRLLTADEAERLRPLNLDAERVPVLCWALKEAVLKGRQTGFRTPARDLDLHLRPADAMPTHGAARIRDPEARTWHLAFEERQGYYLAVAWR